MSSWTVCDLLSIQADETTVIATQSQLVLVLRYIDDKHSVQERFFEFIPLQSATSESIATALRERLAAIVPEDQKSKLICQAYDEGCHCRCSEENKRCVPKCPLYPLLRTSAQPDHATGHLLLLLEHQDFKFFLELLHHIMPHVDLLYAKLQKKNIDSVHIKGSIQQFEQDTQKIRNSLHFMGEQSSGSLPAKRRRVLSSGDRQRIAEEGDRFEEHHRSFYEDALRSTLKAYPMLNGSKLETELGLIYSKEEFRACFGTVDLFHLFMENNIEDSFQKL